MDLRLKQLEDENMSRNNFRNFMQIKVDDIEAGYALVSMPITETLLQAAGNVHGGVFSVLLDSAIGTAVRSVTDITKEYAVTAEMNLNYLRGARDGTLYAEAKVISQGKLLIVGMCDIRDADGKLLATGRATFVRREKHAAAK